MESKHKWLFQLRKCSNKETLEKVVEINRYKLSDDELEMFNSAADHRLAELTMNRRMTVFRPVSGSSSGSGRAGR